MSTFPSLYIPSRPRIVTAAEYARQKMQQATNAALDRAKRFRASLGTLFAQGRFVNAGGRVVNASGQRVGDTADCGVCPCGSGSGSGAVCPACSTITGTTIARISVSGFTLPGAGCVACEEGTDIPTPGDQSFGGFSGVNGTFDLPQISTCLWSDIIGAYTHTDYRSSEMAECAGTADTRTTNIIATVQLVATGSGTYKATATIAPEAGDYPSFSMEEPGDDQQSTAPVAADVLCAGFDLTWPTQTSSCWIGWHPFDGTPFLPRWNSDIGVGVSFV